MANVVRKKGKKNRCHGRNKSFCTRYRNSHQRERNKARRLGKHLARHPNDRCALAALGLARAVL
jgi:hypothetical protein